MSVKLMSAIFETEFRDLSDGNGDVTKASTAKLVLLALADHANDEGESAYPSIDRLSRKTALSPQTIRNTLDALKFNGVVFLEGTSKLRTNNYTINTRSFPRLAGDSDGILTLNPLEGQISEVEPSNQSLLTLNRLDPNHQLTPHEPPDSPISSSAAKELTSEDYFEAGEKVKKILELSIPSANTWEGREFFRDNHLHYADWWNKITNQKCTKKKIKSWQKAFSDWQDEGLDLPHLQEAYNQDVGWKKVIADPNELTKKAAAIKALHSKPQQMRLVETDDKGTPISY